MAFIKILELTKTEIKCLVGPTSISVCSVPSAGIFMKFNSFIQFLKDLEFYFFPIFILIGLGLHLIKFIW